MNIRCGHCTGRHDSVQAVRECANGYSAEARVAGGSMARTPRPTGTLPDVPAGRYAVEVAGELAFFKIDRPTEGRWAGYTFVKQFASDETYPVKNSDKRLYVLRKIEKDPEEAMLKYGREIGHCGHCGRTLTNAESRARGIGPVCADKMGW